MALCRVTFGGKQHQMPVRKRSARSSTPGAPSDGGVATDLALDDEIARPVHQTNWLGGLLVEQGSITPEQLDEALAEQAEDGGRIGEILLRRGALAEAALARGLAEQLDLPVIDLRLRTPQPEALALLPEAMVRKYRALPMALADDELYVAIDGPIADSVLTELRETAGVHVLLVISPASDIDTVIDRSYSALHGLEQYTEAFGAEENFRARSRSARRGARRQRAGRAGGARASSRRPSATARPTSTSSRRTRRSGSGSASTARCTTPPTCRPRSAQALVSRIKIMADMNIVERRRAQDGQFEATVDGNALDVRVATTATIWGEKAVLRLLDKSTFAARARPRSGMQPETGERFSKLIRSPFGMVICAGPTGSGKTTTLYAALSEINDPSRNITTIEDPVEYVFPSINQIQINEQAGITFAGGLKSILRQDPDVILVGEIRDVETARIAVQSALTGHLVLSSLHATDATSALHRFVDMGIEPFLVASSVLGVVAQRLVRRICSACREPYEPRADELAFYEAWGGKPEGRVLPRRRLQLLRAHRLLGTASACTSCCVSPKRSASWWSSRPRTTSSRRSRSTRACARFVTRGSA